MVLTTVATSPSALKAATSKVTQPQVKSATSLRIQQACNNVAQFRIPTYAQDGGILSNKSYWRGLDASGFIDRGKFLGKWAIPILVVVVWAAPRPFLWEKIDQVLYGAAEE